MTASTIMVIDDEVEILELISLFLERENYNVVCLQSGGEALEKVKEINPDLLILDVRLSDADGIDICYQLRKFTDIPILIVSCKGEDLDKVVGLRVGGDDYITKPFSPIELVARVKAHLRRSRMLHDNRLETVDELKYKDLTINLYSQTVHLHGQSVQLSSREFKLLALMAQHPGRVYSTETLFDLVWGLKSFSDTRTVMVHISNLRKKIENNPSAPDYILTVRGAGYKFNVELSKGTESADTSVASIKGIVK